MKERGRRRKLTGVVVSDSMDKTIVVEVERVVRHPKYDKILRLRRKHKAHDENNEASVGDRVEITEARPMSKTKCWRLSEIMRKAEGLIDVEEDLAAEAAPSGAAPAADESVAPDTENSSDSGPDQT